MQETITWICLYSRFIAWLGHNEFNQFLDLVSLKI